MEPLIYNKKISLDYEVMEKLDAGIELIGLEVKSLRKKQGALAGAFIVIRGGEAFLMNAFIPPYQENNTPTGYDPYHTRKLLLTKKEIARLANIESGKGLTIVPISMYNSKRNIKVEIGIVRGKKKFDKRETIKKRETDREVAREFRDR